MSKKKHKKSSKNNTLERIILVGLMNLELDNRQKEKKAG